MVGELALAMPHATRIRIPDRERINAFLYSNHVVPQVMTCLVSTFAVRLPAR